MQISFLNPKYIQQMASVISRPDCGQHEDNLKGLSCLHFPWSSAWILNSLLFLSKQPLSAIPLCAFCFRISALIFQQDLWKTTNTLSSKSSCHYCQSYFINGYARIIVTAVQLGLPTPPGRWKYATAEIWPGVCYLLCFLMWKDGC